MTRIPEGVKFPPIPSALPMCRRSDGFLDRARKVVQHVVQLSPRTQIVVGICGCAVGSAILATFNPTQYGFYPQCFLYKTTGIYCPGCGATRALYALLHGRFLDALHDNVIVVSALPLIGWAMMKMLIPTWQNNRWPEPRMPGKTCSGSFIIIVLMILFGVMRNVPLTFLDVIRPNCEPVKLHFSPPQQRTVFGVWGY